MFKVILLCLLVLLCVLVEGFINTPSAGWRKDVRLLQSRWKSINLPASHEEGEQDVMTLRHEAEKAETTALFEALVDSSETSALPKAITLLRHKRSLFDMKKKTGLKLLDKIALNYMNEDEGVPGESALDLIYGELKRNGYLRVFGSIDMSLLPEKRREISPFLLEKLTGMSMASLTPGGQDQIWMFAGVGFCLLEYFFFTALNIDPVGTIIPITAAVFVLDRLLLQGAAFETLAQVLIPSYRRKVIVHEAGHFLLSYLMGCPVQGCIVNPWEIRKFGSAGSGGTIFSDPTFGKQLNAGEVKRSSIDRFSIILMGGIAAEAHTFGKAEGGMADEATLIQILSTIQPPFTFAQVRSQALWAAVEAVLLIKEHQEGLDALVEALERNESLEGCVTALEGAFENKSLPSEKRVRSLAEDAPDTSLPRQTPIDSTWGREVKALTPAQEVRQMMQTALQAKRVSSTLGYVKQSTASLMEDFVSKLRALEEEAASSDVELSRVDSGGVWLNDLKALKEAVPTKTVTMTHAPMELREEKHDQTKLDDPDAKRRKNEAKLAEIEAKLQQIGRRHDDS